MDGEISSPTHETERRMTEAFWTIFTAVVIYVLKILIDRHLKKKKKNSISPPPPKDD
jgi:hypothetical protein